MGVPGFFFPPSGHCSTKANNTTHLKKLKIESFLCEVFISWLTLNICGLSCLIWFTVQWPQKCSLAKKLNEHFWSLSRVIMVKTQCKIITVLWPALCLCWLMSGWVDVLSYLCRGEIILIKNNKMLHWQKVLYVCALVSVHK